MILDKLTRPSPKELSSLYMSLSYLVRAGFTLRESFVQISQDPDIKISKTVLKDVITDLDNGEKYANIFEKHEFTFGENVWKQVDIADRSGTLDACFSRISKRLKSSGDFTGKVKGALIYPVIMIILGFVVALYLLTSVMPDLAEMMIDMGGTLPEFTVAMMDFANWFMDHVIISVMLLLCLVAGVWWVLRFPLRFRWHSLLVRLPAVKHIVIDTNYSQIYLLLNDMISSGASTIDAFKLAISSSKNLAIVHDLTKCVTAMEREGISIAEALQSSYTVPTSDRLMLDAGGKSGRTMEILSELADRRTDAAREAINIVTEILAPMFTMLACGIVVAIIMSIYIPAMSLTSQMI